MQSDIKWLRDYTDDPWSGEIDFTFHIFATMPTGTGILNFISYFSFLWSFKIFKILVTKDRFSA